MTTPRIGVIGLGSIGQLHIETWRAVEAEPVAVTDSVAAAREKNQGSWAMHESGEALITSGEVDIVSICTPPAFHKDLAVAALEAGLTVLCEKPLAHTVEDAEAIADAVKRTSGTLHVGFCHRFEPALEAIKQLIEDGSLGTVITLRNRFAGHMEHPEATWFANPAISGGGALADTTIHSIDMYRYLLGNVTQVRALTSTQESELGPALEVEDTGVLVLMNAERAVGVLESSWRTPPGEWTIAVYGTAGSAHFDYGTGKGTLINSLGEEQILEFEEGDRFQAEFRHVIECWSNGGRPRASVEDGVAANRILAEAYADASR